MSIDPGIFADVLKQAQNKIDPTGAGTYHTFQDNLQAFIHAIAWKEEKWIWLLIGFHIVLWISTIFLRNRIYFQVTVFLFNCLLVFLSETLNELANITWKSFSTQNYFDKRGVFAGVMFAAPLILLLLFQVINLVYLSSNMLILQKRAELRGIPPPGSKQAKDKVDTKKTK